MTKWELPFVPGTIVITSYSIHYTKLYDELLTYATSKLKEIEGITIYGEAPKKSGAISFNIEDIHSYDLGVMIDKMGIAIRTGHHCAYPIMDHYNIQGCARISFGMYNTKEEIDKFLEALNKVRTFF